MQYYMNINKGDKYYESANVKGCEATCECVMTANGSILVEPHDFSGHDDMYHVFFNKNEKYSVACEKNLYDAKDKTYMYSFDGVYDFDTEMYVNKNVISDYPKYDLIEPKKFDPTYEGQDSRTMVLDGGNFVAGANYYYAKVEFRDKFTPAGKHDTCTCTSDVRGDVSMESFLARNGFDPNSEMSKKDGLVFTVKESKSFGTYEELQEYARSQRPGYSKLLDQRDSMDSEDPGDENDGPDVTD